jgi:hypothetical protein
VHFLAIFGGGAEPPDDLDAVLRRVQEKAGFARQVATRSFRAADDGWERMLALARDGSDLDAASEDAEGDDHVLAYPVRTCLSRLLSGGADCVLVVRATLEETPGGFFGADLKSEIADAVEALDLERKQVLYVAAQHVVAKQDGPQKLFPEFNQVAQELGFREAGGSIESQEDIRYKDLLGKPAPEFTLESFQSSQPTSLRSLIAGKVTILTFWGYG